MPQPNKRSFRQNQTAQNPPVPTSSLPHQSNSVPSTPMRLSRDRKRRAQSPSPGKKNPSPQSVTSDIPDSRSLLSRSRYSCRFESNACLGRRRIPYNIGDEALPQLENVKESLTAEEDRILGVAADALYKRLLPSTESEHRRRKFSFKLEKLLETKWPGYQFAVHVFGSSGNLLCTSDSDVDVCIETDFKELENMHPLAELLAANGMEKVVCVSSAKVPIVKIWDPELELCCDMNVNNTLALDNTRMVRTYVQLDPRVRPLAMIVKYWTKQRILNDAAIGGTFSSYTWICMIINFLQTREPPVLPALHQLPHQQKMSSDGVDAGFADDVESIQEKSRNQESLAQLLFGFFLRYGHHYDYDESVISVRHGKILSRKEKGWQTTSKDGQWRLCVEEPFSVSRNLGNSADDTAFRGIHLELRRAFDLLAAGDLEGVCEEFVWVQSDEKTTTNSSIFQKPNSSQSKPVLLSQPPSRGNRSNGNSSHSRNRHNAGSKAPPPFRRMSNSSQYGPAFANQQFPPSSPILNYVHSPDGNIILLPSNDAPLRSNAFIPFSITSNPRFPFLVSAAHQYGFVPYSTAALSSSNLAAWATIPTSQAQAQSQTPVSSQPQSHSKAYFHHSVPINPSLSNLPHRASTGALSPPKSAFIRTPLSSTVPVTSCLLDGPLTASHESYEFTRPLQSATPDRHDSDTSSPMSDQENIHRSSVSDVSSEWIAPQSQSMHFHQNVAHLESASSAHIPVPKSSARNATHQHQYLGRADFRAGAANGLQASSPNSYPGWVLSPDPNSYLRQPYPRLDIPSLPQFPNSQAKSGNSKGMGISSRDGSKRNSRSLSPSKLLDDQSLVAGHFSSLGRSPTETTHDGSILIANGSHMLASKTPGAETPDSGLNFWNYGFGFDWVQGQDGILYQIARPVDSAQFATHTYPTQDSLDPRWVDSDATQFHLETSASRETPFGTDSDTSGETAHPSTAQWTSQLSQSLGRVSLHDRAPVESRMNSQALFPTQERGISPSSVTNQRPEKSRSNRAQVNGHGSAKGQYRADDAANADMKHGKHTEKMPKSSATLDMNNHSSRHSSSRSRQGSNPPFKGKPMEQWQWQPAPTRGKYPSKANEEKLVPIPVNMSDRKGG